MMLFFTHIPFVVNHTINATPPERLQHLIPLVTVPNFKKVQQKALTARSFWESSHLWIMR